MLIVHAKEYIRGRHNECSLRASQFGRGPSLSLSVYHAYVLVYRWCSADGGRRSLRRRPPPSVLNRPRSEGCKVTLSLGSVPVASPHFYLLLLDPPR